MFCLVFFLQGSDGDMIFGTHLIGSERILICTRRQQKTQVMMDKDRTHDWETHGRSNDIESTPMDKVKAPNVFERAKEEIEALVETIHSKRTPDHEQHAKKDGSKEGTEEPLQKEKTHHKETHGMSDDIDEDTPIDKVKGPNVFERAKEEIEAIVVTIHPKDESNSKPQKKKDGFWEFLAKCFDKCCSPSSRKRD
ncbi:hypothetical protein MUK42_12222 [Musa troglodytarum]|uniref:Uncharacterized protein n=1 Tax=Musa troglodytarum TaxID=320322 RepID=A0A9E7GM33_9LILI|nr:hypothetical protein MUK42_12222 [Musa troglodytarum]